MIETKKASAGTTTASRATRQRSGIGAIRRRQTRQRTTRPASGREARRRP